MAVMQWSDKLQLNVKSIDDQHHKLLDLMNKLHDSYQNKDVFSTQHKYLDELGAATVQHFQDEEVYMESINYDGLAVHKIIHQDLLEKFTDHKNKALEAQALTDGFFTFLKVWLTAHIMGIDVKYTRASNAA